MKLKLLLIFILSIFMINNLYARGNISTKPVDVFKGCAKCHGKNGRNTAFGRSEPLAGQNVEDLVESITFFKESTFERRGVMLVMSKQVKHLNEEDIKSLAEYISKL